MSIKNPSGSIFINLLISPSSCLKDSGSATATLIDISSLGEWSKIEVTFEVYGLEDAAAPAETEAAADEAAAPADTEVVVSAATEAVAAGNTNTGAAADKNNADTGVEGVAAVAGVAIIAAGAIIIAKKRK